MFWTSLCPVNAADMNPSSSHPRSNLELELRRERDRRSEHQPSTPRRDRRRPDNMAKVSTHTTAEQNEEIKSATVFVPCVYPPGSVPRTPRQAGGRWTWDSQRLRTEPVWAPACECFSEVHLSGNWWKFPISILTNFVKCSSSRSLSHHEDEQVRPMTKQCCVR